MLLISMRFIGIVFIILFLSGCYEIKSEKSNLEIEHLYESFINKLNSGEYKLIKYTSSKCLDDTTYLDSIDWNQELKLFTELNISKSQIDDYDIIISKNGCEKKFQTNSKKHSIKKYKYSHCDGNLIVFIDITKSSPLYTFSYHLELNNKGYLIHIKSDVGMAYEADYKVEGKFILSKTITH